MSQGARKRRPATGVVRSNDSFRDRRVHLVGIGGCGMRGAAGVLLRSGAIVTGSDCASSGELIELVADGAAVRIGQRAENIPAGVDLVVHSAAIKPDNIELVTARRCACEVIKYAELLGRLMRQRTGIAISGTHGKSTTTAMTAWILRRAGLDPSFVVGTHVPQLGGGSGVGDGPHFVVEACEFDRSFLSLRPTYGAILNVEEDHLDCFSGLEEIISAFGSFASLVPSGGVLVVNGEDSAAMKAAAAARTERVETFGFRPDVIWRATNLERLGGAFRFDLECEGHALARPELQIPGRHHVANALAAAAVARACGVDAEDIADALTCFKGTERRLSRRGNRRGVLVLDDYGHHPTEIQVTLQAARDHYQPRRLYVVFQPHQYSRTRFLLNDFARSFRQADVVIVPDICFVRDTEAERSRIDAGTLVDRIRGEGRDARYEPRFDRIVAMLTEELEPGDVVVTMGAGDVWKIAVDLVTALGRESAPEQADAEAAVEPAVGALPFRGLKDAV